MKKIILIVAGLTVAILVLISGPGCGSQWMLFYDKSITGQVVDAETGKPVENVIVISMWQLTQYLSHGHGGYAKVITSKTDKDGKFKIPFWITFKPWKWNSSMDEYAPKLVLYKPGFNLFTTHRVLWEKDMQDMNMTEQEKKKVRDESSIKPAKLIRIYTDEHVMENHKDFRSQANFPEKVYSNKQLEEIFNAIQKDAEQLSSSNQLSKRLLMKDIQEDREFYIGGR